MENNLQWIFEFRPFFDGRYEGLSNHVLEKRPRGDSNPYLQYVEIGLFPVYTPAILVVRPKGKLPSALWPDLTERHKNESLRQLANEYGVSHDAVRRTIARARNSPLDKRLSKT